MHITALFESAEQAEQALAELRQQDPGARLSVLGSAEPLNGADARIEPLARELDSPPAGTGELHPVGWPREANRLPDGPHRVGAVLVSLTMDREVDEASLQQVLERHGGQIHRGVRGEG